MPRGTPAAIVTAAGQIAGGIIINSHLAASAAIAFSKLNIGTDILDAHINASAAIAESKLNLDQGTQATFDAIATDIATHAALSGAHHTAPSIAAGFVVQTTRPGTPGNGCDAATQGTTGHVAAFLVPLEITITKVTFRTHSTSEASATGLFAIFSADGQTQHVSGTIATISASTTRTVTVSSVTLPAGLYYFFWLGTNGQNLNLMGYDDTGYPNFGSAGENESGGRVTITQDTMPSTFDPDGDVSFFDEHNPVIRLDV